MRVLNYEYIDFSSLNEFITNNSIPNTNNVLIQIFSSKNENILIDEISTNLSLILDKVPYITTTTAGVINGGKILDDNVTISFSIFSNTKIKSIGFKGKTNSEILNLLSEDIIDNQTKLLVCFANTYSFNAELFLNDLTKKIPNLIVVGGYAGDNYHFKSCYLSTNNLKDCDVIFASLSSSVLKVEQKYLLNWESLGNELTVTKSTGTIVEEINNINILEMYKHYLGNEIVDNIINLGIEFPLIYKENGIDVARAPLGFTENNSLIFGGNIPVGTKVKFGYANFDYIDEYNKINLPNDLKYKHEGIFIYSCSARRSMLGTYLDDELKIFQSFAETSGFITYGEFYYNSTSCKNNLLNITTTYVTLNESEKIIPIDYAKIDKRVKSNRDITIKALTTFLKKSTDELEDYKNQLKLSLEKSTTYTNVMLDSFPFIIWLKDIDGKYLSVNKKYLEEFGFSEVEDVVGKYDFELFNEEKAKAITEEDLEVISTKTLKKNIEKSFLDDKEKWHEIYKIPVSNENMGLIGILGFAIDITEKHNSQIYLNKQKEELEIIFNTSLDGLALIDLDTNFLKVNKSICSILDSSEEELLNSSCYDIGDNRSDDDFQKSLNTLLEKGYIYNIEKEYRLKDRRIVLSVSAALIPNEKKAILSIKDMTKNRVYEEQAKLASMGEMLGNIAHQWRQPLSIISTISSSLVLREEMGTLEGYNISKDMDEIVNQTKYLSRTIEDFRNFLKKSNDKERFSLVNTLKKMIRILRFSFDKNNIELISDFTDDLVIYGNENEIIQSLINIANNSKDAVLENCFDKRLVFIKTFKCEDNFVIEIYDNGGGINDSILSRVFEPYFTTKQQDLGTGIGLSMSHEILVDRHNAYMEVSNRDFVYRNQKYYGALFKIIF